MFRTEETSTSAAMRFSDAFLIVCQQQWRSVAQMNELIQDLLTLVVSGCGSLLVLVSVWGVFGVLLI